MKYFANHDWWQVEKRVRDLLAQGFTWTQRGGLLEAGRLRVRARDGRRPWKLEWEPLSAAPALEVCSARRLL
jgi:hypothetical protein